MTWSDQQPAHTRWAIRGTGSYLPERRVPSTEVARSLGLDEDWIERRTGIRNRHAAAPAQAASDLAAAAAREALDAAGLRPDDVGLIVLGTSTPDELGPSTACRVQALLGARGAAAFDVAAACTGFVFGLQAALGWLAAQRGAAPYALVIGVEVYSRFLDPADRGTAALFGDGAAAAVVASGQHSLARIAGSAEKLWPDTLRIMGWEVEDPGLSVVFDRAIPPFIEAELAGAVDEMCAGLGIEREDIGRLCSHPGGAKVVDAIESALQLPQGELNLEREVLHDFGNMSAPTVMFVLDRLMERGLPDRTMMTAFGPGFTCAGLLLEAA